MSLRSILCLMVFLIGSLLTGCQTALEPTELPVTNVQYWSNMQQRLASLSVLNLQGRIGYISQQERGSASFDFQAQGQEFELALYSTLAVQVAKLTQLPHQAELLINNELKTAERAEDLLYRELKLSLPASELKALFLGLPPGERSYSADGRITGASFNGYSINYTSFKIFSGYALPVEFSIRQGGNLIKVKVNQVLELH